MALAVATVLSGRFRVRHYGRTVVLVRAEYEQPLGALLSLPVSRVLEQAPGPIRRFRGRGSPFSFAIPGGPGERAIVRRYRRGGILRHVLPSWFLGGRRPLRELQASEHALERRVATAPVLAVVGLRRFLALYSWYIALLEIDGSRDLESCFRERTPGVDRREVIREAAHTVAALHAAGLDHADLHLKNLLLDEGQVRVIDLDKASHRDPLPPTAIEANLLRLDRSVVKLNRRGARVSRTDRLRFLREYFGGRMPERGELLRLLKRQSRALMLHRAGWSLAAWVGAGPSKTRATDDA